MVDLSFRSEALAMEMEALFACAHLLQSHWPRARDFDVVFVPGLAVDNWQRDERDSGILATAARLYTATRVGYVVIPGYPGTFPEGTDGPRAITGYPGSEVWRNELEKLRVHPDHIVFYAEDKVGPDRKSWNTRTETDAFIKLAKSKKWTSAIVLTTPFHTLRVMLTLVKALRDASYSMSCLPLVPRSIAWRKEAFHSQGKQRLPRCLHIQEEWNRIGPYRRNGSLCSFQELRDYLLSVI